MSGSCGGATRPKTAASTYLNATQAAAILGVHPETVVRAINAGRIPGFRLQRTYRILRTVVDELDQRMHPPTAEQIRAISDPSTASLAAAKAELARCQGALSRALAHLERAG